ncbi:DUF2971 domain-containing protein [Rhizobium cauense]|uniref:DUF2971 domain-containing protein n=1 Tax=Rhizobium cauense TaxID=1166683 RepID=UPI001C6E772F|nr:DUF2971 domain-containing protein [Rhizobium cauense]MBW9113180.1 DUF2971 domain-containing protein [Rhizobium cauense]
MSFEPHPELPQSLYKYCSQAAARATLASGTLQFSRPGLFNDGFDLRIALALNINEEIVIERALEQMYDGAYGSTSFLPGNRLGALLLIMRQLQWKPEPGEFKEALRPAVKDLVANRNKMLQQLSDALAAEAAKFKVLCLSSSPTVAPLWGNYAENIQGVALQFSPRSDDSIFLTARPVNYVEHEPVLFDDQGFIDWLSGRRGFADTDVSSQVVYTKTADWAYEREWRIVAGCGWKPDEEREFVEFSVDDLEAVIFGSRTTEDFREEVKQLVAERYPSCKLRQLKPATGRMTYEIADL